METEIWKAHPGIPGIEVSTLGRVRTLDRVVSTEKMTRFQKGRVLKQRDNGRGYLIVNIPINGKQVTKKVHRLVAQTFIPNSEELPQVNHKNCVRDDDRVINLEWCDGSYNQKYREKYGVSQTDAAGHPLFAIKLVTLEVLHFSSQHEASRALGIHQGSINAVIKKKLSETNGFWFVNDGDNAVELADRKLYEGDEIKLIATDDASTEFVSQFYANLLL